MDNREIQKGREPIKVKNAWRVAVLCDEPRPGISLTIKAFSKHGKFRLLLIYVLYSKCNTQWHDQKNREKARDVTPYQTLTHLSLLNRGAFPSSKTSILFERRITAGIGIRRKPINVNNSLETLLTRGSGIAYQSR